ncbi:MAG: RidA family protein [Thermomicrobiales bacterium]|nr:RidA family protein [Thermomicrobiales bacterium]
MHGHGSTRPLRAQIEPDTLDNAIATRLAYANGVRVGETVWIAGQVARDAAGNLIGENDVEAQAVQCYENVRAVVEAAGGTMADIVRCNAFITDRAHRMTVNAVRGRYFQPPHLPTGMLLIVAGLPLPEYLIEIEAVAVIGSSAGSTA